MIGVPQLAAMSRRSTTVAQRRRRLRWQLAVRRRDASGQSRLEHPGLLPLSVLTQHQAILDQSVDRADHLAVVLAERGIALLDRRARIAGGQALGLGSRERNILTRLLTAVIRLWPRSQRPPGIGSERYRHVGQAHAGDFIAVAVGL